MHSGRLRRDLQVHCRAGQCLAPEAPGVLPVLRRSVHLGRIRLLRRGPGGVTPITDTLLPRVLLRCSGCGLRWTAATLDPAACPACGRREGIALVRRFGAGTMSLQAGPSGQGGQGVLNLIACERKEVQSTDPIYTNKVVDTPDHPDQGQPTPDRGALEDLAR